MKLLKKIDDNILKALLMLFVFFIPLFPKFPFRVVNYTYIAIRLDDLLCAILAVVFIVQLVRKKVSFKDLPYKKLFAAFWVVVFLSFLSGMYITKTIEFPFVALLHSARRIEYMMMFFIAYSVIKTSADFKKLLFTFLTSLFLINIYGIGQRFFEFPAISTMNPEFAKGRILFLTPEARLSSTFAGHYDLAAYLVLMIPLLWGLFMYAKRIQISQKMKAFTLGISLLPIVLAAYTLSGISAETINHIPIAGTLFSPLNQLVVGTILFAISMYLVLFNQLGKSLIFFTIVLSTLSLVLTASRTSSIAYIVSTLPYLLYIRKFRYFIIAVVLSVGVSTFDTELAQRWLKTVQIRQVVVNENTGEEVVVQKLKKDSLPAGNAIIRTRNTLPVTAEAQLTKKDLLARATLSGQLNASGSAMTEDDYTVISAVAADTSISTRLQVSWPRAFKAFLKNPLLGSGPSSISESSDGDYFRWIGETGALGALLFLGIIATVLKGIYAARNKVSEEGRFLIVGLMFGTLGLMVNAILIDVFEASKVAYLFWTLLGVFSGMSFLEKDAIKKV
ncbi:O-antigen ligase family protein [Candidatus Woesebacteria bacterium]|nr:O-antigen ligase family protein [Candidatus Woesebacteria bacterium]